MPGLSTLLKRQDAIDPRINPLIDQTGGPMSPWDPPLSASSIAEGIGCMCLDVCEYMCLW